MRNVTILCCLFIFVNLLVAQAFHISQSHGKVAREKADSIFQMDATPGFKIKIGDTYFTDSNAKLVLSSVKFGDVLLAPKSKLVFQEQKDNETIFQLRKGQCKIEASQADTQLRFLTPSANVIVKAGTVYIQVRKQGRETWVIVEKGKAQALPATKKESENPPTEIKPNQAATLDPYNLTFNVLSEEKLDSLKDMYAFRGKNKDAPENSAEMMDAPNETKLDEPKEEEDKNDPGSTKVSDGELVEGQASGAGEYALESSIPIIVYILIAIAIISGFIIWWLKRRKKEGGSGGAKARDTDEYEDEDVHVIRENLTSHSGLLKTHKTTHILGNVEDGASIEAEHKLVIRGSFQGASLKASDNVTIKGGINGQEKALLEIAGDLQTSYISDATAVVKGDVIVDNAIRNSRVASDGKIEVSAKSIMGGTVASASTIECPSLGSDFCETRILLGKSSEQIWEEEYVKELKEKSETSDSEASGENAESDVENEESQTSEDTEPAADQEAESETSTEPESEPEAEDGDDKPKAEWKPLNDKASLRVIDELNSASIYLGDARLEQKKSVPGPVETYRDPANPNILQLRGYRRET